MCDWLVSLRGGLQSENIVVLPGARQLHQKNHGGKKPDIFQATCNIYKMCQITLHDYEYLLVLVEQKEIRTKMSQHGMIKAVDGLYFFINQ